MLYNFPAMQYIDLGSVYEFYAILVLLYRVIGYSFSGTSIKLTLEYGISGFFGLKQDHYKLQLRTFARDFTWTFFSANCFY